MADWRSKVKGAPNSAPVTEQPLYEGQVDLTFVVSATQPWG